MAGRDYLPLGDRATPRPDREEAMRLCIDMLWDAFGPGDVTWAGFYLPRGNEMVMGPSCPKPACSPIPLTGICGRAYETASAVIVDDLQALEEGEFVACDPADRSEIVIPVLESSGEVWGVLDLDSHDVGAFDVEDVKGLMYLLGKFGLFDRARGNIGVELL